MMRVADRVIGPYREAVLTVHGWGLHGAETHTRVVKVPIWQKRPKGKHRRVKRRWKRVSGVAVA